MIQAELYIAQNAHKRAVWGGFSAEASYPLPP